MQTELLQPGLPEHKLWQFWNTPGGRVVVVVVVGGKVVVVVVVVIVVGGAGVVVSARGTQFTGVNAGSVGSQVASPTVKHNELLGVIYRPKQVGTVGGVTKL